MGEVGVDEVTIVLVMAEANAERVREQLAGDHSLMLSTVRRDGSFDEHYSVRVRSIGSLPDPVRIPDEIDEVIAELAAPTEPVCGALQSALSVANYSCTLVPNHKGDQHVATGVNGRVLARWPR